jgi:hypothetical protein
MCPKGALLLVVLFRLRFIIIIMCYNSTIAAYATLFKPKHAGQEWLQVLLPVHTKGMYNKSVAHT